MYCYIVNVTDNKEDLAKYMAIVERGETWQQERIYSCIHIILQRQHGRAQATRISTQQIFQNYTFLYLAESIPNQIRIPF